MAGASAVDGLADPLQDADTDDASSLSLTCQGFVTMTDEFLAAAQRNGGGGSLARGRDVFLVLATSWVPGATLADESSTAALNAVMREAGLRPSLVSIGRVTVRELELRSGTPICQEEVSHEALASNGVRRARAGPALGGGGDT